jgi:hypothetical protein
MTAPRPKPQQHVDPYLRAVDKYRKRGWTLACDCPCHWFRGVREAVRCCDMQGMRYVAAENAYVPWTEEDR